jgi:hypothetical protein
MGCGNVSAFAKREPFHNHLAISCVESDLTSPSADPLLQLLQTDQTIVPDFLSFAIND